MKEGLEMMDLIRWNPLKEMLSLRDHMTCLLDDSLFRSDRSGEDVTPGMWSPAVDMFEKAEFQNGLLTIEVPKPEQHKPKQITVN